MFGYVQTLGSLFQFIGSPLMGMAMDKYGYKWGLLVSQVRREGRGERDEGGREGGEMKEEGRGEG